jgi:hypothetical protein
MDGALRSAGASRVREGLIMTENFDAAAHVAHMETVVDLDIDPAWRPGVVNNVAIAARMAALVLSFPLDDAVEPAGVFEAGR